MFRPDGAWRDILALDWHLRTLAAQDLAGYLEERLPVVGLEDIRLHPVRSEPRWVLRGNVECVELFFEFSQRLGRGEGLARLRPDAGGGPAIWHFFTYLNELSGSPDKSGPNRPRHRVDRTSRVGASASADRRPEVLIVGAGQAGLSLAARLARIGVDAIVVERNARVGQNWRERYDALTLHNAVTMINLPYMEFPKSWPKYLAKDLVADWLELYASAMGLEVWTESAVQSIDYDPDEKEWSVTLVQGDGPAVTVRCPHVVVATGVSGKPRIPDISGLPDFRGVTMHSSQYTDGSPFRGKKALVFGTGASGHDIAQDLHRHGAEVTLVQRGSMSVCSIEPGASEVLDKLFEERSNEEADLIAASVPYENRVRNAQLQSARLREVDAKLYAGLSDVGFKFDFGVDDTGIGMKYLRQGGGFYLNVGCSDLLIKREIKLLQAEHIACFVEQGVRLSDGSEQDADIVVMATGYEPQSEVNGRLLGSETVEKLGPVWGMDLHGEQQNAWRRTAEPGLWFMLGNFQQCRFYSGVLATQICAELKAMPGTLAGQAAHP